MTAVRKPKTTDAAVSVAAQIANLEKPAAKPRTRAAKAAATVATDLDQATAKATAPAISFDRDKLIGDLYKLDEQKKKAAAVLKEIESKIAVAEEELIQHLGLEGLGRADLKNGLGVQVDESIVPQVEDWEAFFKFMASKKQYHMVERRPSVTAYRELRELGKVVPGLRDFTKKKLRRVGKRK